MRILSVDGGGYLGLAPAAFLQEAEHHFGSRAADRFDLFCGTSTGAIVALALAFGMSAADVAALYERLGPRVFPRRTAFGRAVRAASVLVGVKHDNAPLRRALTEAFGDATLGDLRARGKHALVTAFCLTTGRPRVFKTDHAPELTAHDGYRLRDVALASAAAPTYLPLVDVADPRTGVVEWFCDGGLVANSPALLGYAEAVSHLGRSPASVSVLSLATPRADLAERESARSRAQRNPARSYLGWGLGERLLTLALDGGAAVSDQALRRIGTAGGAGYVRVDFPQPPGVGLDVVTPASTATLRHLGTECARRADQRERLAPLFRD